MNKSIINLLIDIILLVLLCLITSIGLLIHYVLLPGYKVNLAYERHVDLQFLGLDRHQWGDIHLYVSLLFILLIIIHVVLHWKQIVCGINRMLKIQSAKTIVIAFLLAFMLITILGVFFIQPEKIERSRKMKHRFENTNTQNRF
ncbi:DUF4405 domain-containing protein [Prolixibacteraceae bacterium JC049]|nr:DUF4405 domain-containing protein [Prolixibacteraceae bacterium JC049]